MSIARPSGGMRNILDSLRNEFKLLRRTGKVVRDADERMLDVLDKHDGDLDFVYRNFQWDKKPQPSIGGGGGTEPIKRGAVAFITGEMEELRPVMRPVMWPLWNRRSIRHYTGVASDINVTAVAGTVYIEPLSGGVPLAYHVNLVPMPGEQTYLRSGMLLGYDVGFGRFGDERLKFRLDCYRFEEDPASASLQQVPDGGFKMWSTREVLSEALFTEYTTNGLRFKCLLSIYA